MYRNINADVPWPIGRGGDMHEIPGTRWGWGQAIELGILLFASNDGGVDDRISHQSGSWSITDRPAVLRYWTLIGICKGSVWCRDRQGWLNRIITRFGPCLVGDAKAMQGMILFCLLMQTWTWLHLLEISFQLSTCMRYWFQNMCWQKFMHPTVYNGERLC
jgi:hypothetical protein